MAKLVTSTPFLLGTLAALAVTLAAVSAQAAWQTPGVPTENLSTPTPQPGITATINTNAYFKITQEDVGKAVAEQLQLQAVEPKAEATLTAGSPGVLYSADHPLKVSIHSLQVDTTAKRWQAQAYILGNGQTETVKPVSGSYTALIDVPVLTRQLGRSDIIEAKDLATKPFPERLLRKDSITDARMLIGQSPRSTISTDRPIRQTEVSSPVLIKKGSAVQMNYTNPYMTLKVTGIALQDGARGDMIRVKNDKSEKAVSGRVTGNGTVEVNSVDPSPIASAKGEGTTAPTAITMPAIQPATHMQPVAAPIQPPAFAPASAVAPALPAAPATAPAPMAQPLQPQPIPPSPATQTPAR